MMTEEFPNKVRLKMNITEKENSGLLYNLRLISMVLILQEELEERCVKSTLLSLLPQRPGPR